MAGRGQQPIEIMTSESSKPNDEKEINHCRKFKPWHVHHCELGADHVPRPTLACPAKRSTSQNLCSLVMLRVWQNIQLAPLRACSQEQSTSCWEGISILVFSQPGESPILFHPGGGDKKFSQEGCFCLAKNSAGGWKKKRPMIGRTRRKPKENFPGKAEARNLQYNSIIFTSSIILYAVLYLPGRKCPQNRYFKKELPLTALAFTPHTHLPVDPFTAVQVVHYG